MKGYKTVGNVQNRSIKVNKKQGKNILRWISRFPEGYYINNRQKEKTELNVISKLKNKEKTL